MKVLKHNKKAILESFKRYLDGVKDGDKISFEYTPTAKEKVEIVFTQSAYIKMQTLISRCDGEVGWNGVVTKENDLKYIIEDILVYPQEVSGATVTCDEIETGMWLAKQPQFNKIRFQAHSHVNMGVTPSSVDRTMYDNYENGVVPDGDYYIFMIWNKKSEYYVELFDNKNKVIYYKNDITISIEGVDEFWDSISSQIRKKQATVTYSQTKMSEENLNTNKFENCKKECDNCEDFEECIKYYLNKFGE